MEFEVRFLPGAEDNLNKIPRYIAEKIIEKTEDHLSRNPFPHGNIVKRITGVQPPLSRFRFGKWRIFFEIEERTVWVLAVATKPKSKATIKRLRK